jgi:hypothetical protein
LFVGSGSGVSPIDINELLGSFPEFLKIVDLAVGGAGGCDRFGRVWCVGGCDMVAPGRSLASGCAGSRVVGR